MMYIERKDSTQGDKYNNYKTKSFSLWRCDHCGKTTSTGYDDVPSRCGGCGVGMIEYHPKSFKELRKAGLTELERQFNDNLKRAEDDLKEALQWEGKTYKGTEEQQREKLKRWFEKTFIKARQEFNQQIKAVEDASDFGNQLVITVEWKKSYMWGHNPRAYTNYGFVGSSIGGCGYCKHSTSTAEALNSHLPLLRLLYAKEDARLRAFNRSKLKEEDKRKFLSRRAILGYGAGYGILPSFEGGVGVSSHGRIVKNLGLVWRDITSTSKTDVHLITKE